MHSKRKGNIGQMATALWLSNLGYSVFIENGDISKVDIIAEHKGKLVRFQCKAITPTNGMLMLSFRKSGPNYNIKYKMNNFDYFAIYDLINKNLYIISSKILKTRKTGIYLRFNKPKCNQKLKINYAYKYLAENVKIKEFS